jgi:tetratricopeptide (TPR) repeat protein
MGQNTNNLGLSLKALGERENGTKHIKAAITAFRESLKEWTRDRVPLDWAKTKNNLGAALGRLGEREGGTRLLEEAINEYKAALDAFQSMEQWSKSQQQICGRLGLYHIGRKNGARGAKRFSRSIH